MGVDSSAENTWSAQFAQKFRILLGKKLHWASVIRACSQIFQTWIRITTSHGIVCYFNRWYIFRNLSLRNLGVYYYHMNIFLEIQAWTFCKFDNFLNLGRPLFIQSSSSATCKKFQYGWLNHGSVVLSINYTAQWGDVLSKLASFILCIRKIWGQKPWIGCAH